mgnify:FL=1
MLLGYKRSIGGSDAHHYGKSEGVDKKFIRVICGAALPIFDRMLGAVVVIGEIYRPSGPASWVALEANCGEWFAVENALTQFRTDLKFTHIIVEREEARRVLWTMRGLNYGINEIPLTTYAAPFYASQEIGRSYVAEVWRGEGRLVIPDEVQAQIEMEPTMGALALQCVMCWMKDNVSYYAPLRQRERGTGRPLGVEGLE